MASSSTLTLVSSEDLNHGFDDVLKRDAHTDEEVCDELSMIPYMKEMMEAQNKDVKDQREMMESLIRQLGDISNEIANMRDEQIAVRTKQAKALSLLKKQLDHHKKKQSQTCSDILEQVNILNEKFNSSVSSEQLQTVTKTDSPKSSPKSPSSSVKSVQNSKSDLTSQPHSSPSRLSLSPRSNNYGHIIWKIPDVMKKITRIKSGVLDGTLVSNPFQTGKYEYNMNAWVYLNGRAKMVGKHVSVYACVLVGDYDAILPWPVTPTYTFTLIDQSSDPKKRKHHVRHRRVLDIEERGESVISQNGGIPRPTVGSKALIIGLDDFIAHDQLVQGKYLVDDILFLKVEAEVN